MSFNAEIRLESDLFQALSHLRRFLGENDAICGKVNMNLRFENRGDLERFKVACKKSAQFPGLRYQGFTPPMICGIELTVDGYETHPNPFA